ncbi:hypothetical protein Tco_0591322 [Tanacetum coccineum]
MFLNMDQLEKKLDKEEFQEIGSIAAFIQEKIDTTNALDASLVDTQSSGTESKEQDTSSRSDVIETINIKLEHKVAKLLKENETLKRHYKELSDSIKTTRAKTIEHTTSLIAQNADFKAQL